MSLVYEDTSFQGSLGHYYTVNSGILQKIFTFSLSISASKGKKLISINSTKKCSIELTSSDGSDEANTLLVSGRGTFSGFHENFTVELSISYDFFDSNNMIPDLPLNISQYVGQGIGFQSKTFNQNIQAKTGELLDFNNIAFQAKTDELLDFNQNIQSKTFNQKQVNFSISRITDLN